METHDVTDEKGLRGVSVVAVLVECHVDVDQVAVHEWMAIRVRSALVSRAETDRTHSSGIPCTMTLLMLRYCQHSDQRKRYRKTMYLVQQALG
jgi:hypothetical protein